MNDRANVYKIRRGERAESATTDEQKRLVEVESAAVAALDNIRTRKNELTAEGRLTRSAIAHDIAQIAHQWIEQRSDLTKKIVDPIAEKFKDMSRPSLPERAAVHMEASQHYAALPADKRQEAIARAVTGQDDVLAVALLTGRDPISDQTRTLLQNRITSDDEKTRQADREDMLTRIQATRITLNEVSEAIAGETQS